MRMRKKPNLVPRMERCARFLIKQPEAYRGVWRDALAPGRTLSLELGCGKGRFTAALAARNPENLYLAMDRVPEALVVAMECASAASLSNLYFISGDAGSLCDWFSPGEVDMLYINFCDPWPRKRHAKRRLTHANFLAIYRNVLREGGEIRFKTDNEALFDFSLEQFAANGFSLSSVSRNLHAGGPADIMTDYEEKFYSQGLPIFRCVAVKTPIASHEKEHAEKPMTRT
jgi:tRNA (guanine-N7-)-methyltransferase